MKTKAQGGSRRGPSEGLRDGYRWGGGISDDAWAEERLVGSIAKTVIPIVVLVFVGYSTQRPHCMLATDRNGVPTVVLCRLRNAPNHGGTDRTSRDGSGQRCFEL